MSVREECNEDPGQSDETEAETSPPKSPSTPKNVKSKNSGTVGLCGPSWCCQHHHTVGASGVVMVQVRLSLRSASHSPDGLGESF